MAPVPYGLVLPAARPGNLCLQGCSGDLQEARSFVADQEHVVVQVHERINAFCSSSRHKFLVRSGGPLVGSCGKIEITRLKEDVSGHVNQMTGSGHEIHKTDGIGYSAFKIG